MHFNQILPYRKLDSPKNKFSQTNCSRISFAAALTLSSGMIFVLIVMCLLIVKVSSAEALQKNQSQPLQPKDYHKNWVDLELGKPEDSELMSTTNLNERNFGENIRSNFTHLESTTKVLQRSQVDEMRAKLQQLQQQQQEQYARNQMQQQQQQQHQHAISGENSSLMQRTENNQDEQPIYGSWSTKARYSNSSAALANATADMIPRIPSLAITNEAGSDASFRHQQTQHLYERLPKRSATMTPLKRDINDQMPRPPRLTPGQPSFPAVRRQYSETPESLRYFNDIKPKPFHFPHEGSIPEQFTKLVHERPDVNNIQDILQHLHIGDGLHKIPPQMVMMPTGLHVAGSFKNLKSSGIANFFRNKRNKKQMQLSIPLPIPMHLFGGYPANAFNFAAQPHQRIAMDQFYQYKPQSPQDINLLAIQQQLPPKLLAKKKNKKNKQLQQIVANNFLLKHGGQPQNFVADPYISPFPPIIPLNETRQPKLKRLPFNVNFDIYPIMPPTKDYKPLPFTLDDHKLEQSVRPITSVSKPYEGYGPLPMVSSGTATSMYSQSVYGPQRFSTSAQTPVHFFQPGNMHIVFPDKKARYNHLQHQPAQQHYQQLYYSNQLHKQAEQVASPDHLHQLAASTANQRNSKNNQIMVHLNVFPKHKSSTTFKPSTNPFYSNVIHRNTILETPEGYARASAEPQHTQQFAGNSTNGEQQREQQNATQIQQAMSRSDHLKNEPLIDFDHPIVALDSADLPHAAPYVSNNNIEHMVPSPQPDYDQNELMTNYGYNNNANIEEMATEAKTASLFRFPIEDLIQFRVDDAI